MNIVGINFESIVDGEGVRVVVYVSGCEHDCSGCHNPDSHAFDAGREFTPALQEEVIQYVKDTQFVSGITMSGGDPVYSIEDVTSFLQDVRKQIPHCSIWLYSGFLFEEVFEMPGGIELLSLCDIMVDGPFEQAKKSSILPYRGSTNQRIVDVQASLKDGKVVLHEC